MNECNSLTIVPVASVAIKVTFQMSMNKDIICTIKKQVHWTNHAVLTCGYITLRKKIKLNSILKTWISRVYWPWLSEISIISSILFQSSVFFFFLRSNVLLSLKNCHYFLITWLSITAEMIGLEHISSVLSSRCCFLCTLSAQSCVTFDHAVFTILFYCHIQSTN